MAAMTTRHNIFVQLSDFDWYKQQQNTNKLKLTWNLLSKESVFENIYKCMKFVVICIYIYR